MARLVVIGGGAAGMSAASAARRAAPDLDVVVTEAGGFAAYGMCGIPYYLGGLVPAAADLLAYPPSEFRDKRGIDLRLHSWVSEIDPAAHQVRVHQRPVSGPPSGVPTGPPSGAPSGADGGGLLSYDVLIAATGAVPVRPPVPGLDGPRVFTIRSLDEAIGLRRLLDSGAIRHAIVIGAGYIGLEAAEALTEAGAEVEVIEALPRVLGTVDEPIARVVQAELERHTTVRLGARLDEVRGRGRGLTAVVGGTEIRTDLVVIGAGVRPATDLLIRAGAEHLPDQSVRVDASMRTSLPDVFAAGDCAALHHLVLDGPAWVPLGPAANKTGRVAGTVAGGGSASFGGIVGTAVVKVFGLEVARTGLTLAEAQAAGLAAAAVDVVSRSRAKYYPGAQPLHVRLVHAPDGRLLGGQLAGREGAAKRIDVLATALHAGMGVADIAGLDLSYAPPFAPVYDPVLTAAIKAAGPARPVPSPAGGAHEPAAAPR